MKYRKFGRTGLEVSEIALGTWAFGTDVYGAQDEKDSLETIRAALDCGINIFDSAPLYGTAEQDGIAEIVLGKALGADRDRVLITTKFGRNPSSNCEPNFHAQRATESIDDSLKRLGTDHIDVLFFHSPFGPEDIHDDVWGALDKAKQAGKIRFVGHSISMFENTQQMARDWAAERKIDVIQTVLSLLNRESGQLIKDLSSQHDIGFIARESLANGFLTGTVKRDTVFEGGMNAGRTREDIIERVEAVERLGFLVRDDIKSVPQSAMRWVLDFPGISTVLTGAKNAEQVLDCAAAAEATPYSTEELAIADEVHEKDFPAA